MKSFVSEDNPLVLLMNELLMVSNMALAFLRKVANGRQRNTIVFPSFPKFSKGVCVNRKKKR